MKQWKKSSERLLDVFSAALPDDIAVERRQMFGYPCAFVRGNMVTGLHEENFMVRLGDQDRARLLAIPGARTFEPMPGRPMREYVVMPAAWHSDAKTLRTWVALAVAFGKGLPAKVAKKAKAAKAAKVAKVAKEAPVASPAKPAKKLAKKPAKKLAKKPAKKLAKKPAKKLAKKPARKPAKPKKS